LGVINESESSGQGCGVSDSLSRSPSTVEDTNIDGEREKTDQREQQSGNDNEDDTLLVFCVYVHQIMLPDTVGTAPEVLAFFSNLIGLRRKMWGSAETRLNARRSYPASLLEMSEKTPTMLLDRLGSATITAIAIRTSSTAYSTVVTPFCHSRFAPGIESVASFVSISSLDFTRIDLLVILKEPEIK